MGEVIQEEVKVKFKNSEMSKAGRLAMELATEKRRLSEEMEELQEQVLNLSPVTPTGTVDEYVKWVATISAVVGVFLQSAGLMTEGQMLYASSAMCWIYVGHCWNDKAIMIGSAVSGTAVLMNLVKTLV